MMPIQKIESNQRLNEGKKKQREANSVKVDTFRKRHTRASPLTPQEIAAAVEGYQQQQRDRSATTLAEKRRQRKIRIAAMNLKWQREHHPAEPKSRPSLKKKQSRRITNTRDPAIRLESEATLSRLKHFLVPI